MADTSFLLLVKVSGVALFQVFWVTMAGFSLKYFNILNKHQIRGIGTFISHVLYPCLMFSEVLIIWEISEWRLWVPPFALNMLMFIISYIIVSICSIKGTAFNLIVCLLSFPNTGALPLIFIGALRDAFVTEAKSKGKDTSNYEVVFQQAIGFIMLNACIQTIMRWSIAYELMRKPEEIVQEEQRELGQEVSKPSGESEFWMKVKKVANPTLIASLVAIAVASVPQVKALFYQKDAEAPLYQTIFYPILMIGSNAKSILTLQLGFNLAMIFDEKAEGERVFLRTEHYFLNVVLKMLLYPLVALAVVMPLLKVGFMKDEMQSFIAMLQIASPSAITLIVITNVHKFLERETAKCFIYQYIVSIVTLTMASAIFLEILFQGQ